MRFKNFEEVITEARHNQHMRVSVAGAHDPDVLVAIKQAVELKLIEPYFVGNKDEINIIADKIGFNISDFQIYHTLLEEEIAYIAAKLADTGKVHIVMKGFLNSTPFLKGVLNKDLNLRTERILSHLSVFEIPDFKHLYYMSDGGLNIAPDLLQREQILANAINFLHKIEIDKPKVALLSANERVNPKMPVTIECKALVSSAKDGRYGSAILEGPLPLDLAISKDSLYHKGIYSQIEGDADLLIVPNIEAGNILGKAITYFAKGIMAGVVLGAKVPLILNSRSDSAEAKLASIALAVVAANKDDKNGEI